MSAKHSLFVSHPETALCRLAPSQRSLLGCLLMSFRRTLARISSRVQRDGCWGLARWLKYRWNEARWERRLGLETGTPVKISHSDAEDYHPTDYQLVERALNHLRIRRDRDVLLDLGCGKGRVLAVACRYPFRRLFGVEVDQDLAQTAEKNLNRLATRRQTPPVTIDHADAAEWPIPDDVSIVFLFNPFYGETFRRAMSNLRRSWQTRLRPLAVLYIQPVQHPDLLANEDWLELSEEINTWPRHDLRLRIYEPNWKKCATTAVTLA